jgi:hypothetical protein
MSGVLNAAVKAGVEGFLDSGNAEHRRRAYIDFTTMILVFILTLVILGFVGKFLWNGIIVDLFTFAKPARSVWQILGLMVFVSLVHSCR